ncbi:hypothetical protein CsSME_00033576 [Camellia sinensis var. sinensis]
MGFVIAAKVSNMTLIPWIAWEGYVQRDLVREGWYGDKVLAVHFPLIFGITMD